MLPTLHLFWTKLVENVQKLYLKPMRNCFLLLTKIIERVFLERWQLFVLALKVYKISWIEFYFYFSILAATPKFWLKIWENHYSIHLEFHQSTEAQFSGQSPGTLAEYTPLYIVLGYTPLFHYSYQISLDEILFFPTMTLLEFLVDTSFYLT